MTVQDVIDLLSQEITWHSENQGTKDYMFEDGFIAGLQQAKIVVRQLQLEIQIAAFEAFQKNGCTPGDCVCFPDTCAAANLLERAEDETVMLDGVTL